VDERMVKLWADALLKEYQRTSLLTQLMCKYGTRPPPTRFEVLRGWLRWKSYRLREYLRKLWRALLAREEWE
jgi:hypothetical protein